MNDSFSHKELFKRGGALSFLLDLVRYINKTMNIFDDNFRLSKEQLRSQLTPTFKVIEFARNLKQEEKDILKALVWYAASNEHSNLRQYAPKAILEVYKNNAGLIDQTKGMYNDFDKSLRYIQLLKLESDS